MFIQNNGKVSPKTGGEFDMRGSTEDTTIYELSMSEVRVVNSLVVF